MKIGSNGKNHVLQVPRSRILFQLLLYQPQGWRPLGC